MSPAINKLREGLHGAYNLYLFNKRTEAIGNAALKLATQSPQLISTPRQPGVLYLGASDGMTTRLAYYINNEAPVNLTNRPRISSSSNLLATLMINHRVTELKTRVVKGDSLTRELDSWTSPPNSQHATKDHPVVDSPPDVVLDAAWRMSKIITSPKLWMSHELPEGGVMPGFDHKPLGW